MRRTLDSTRHALTGNCAGAGLKDEIREQVAKLHKTVVKALPKGSRDGRAVIPVLKRAKAATELARQGKEVGDEDWEGLRQVLAGELPAWQAEGVRGKAAPKKLSKAVVACVRSLQESAALETTCNIQSRVLMEAFKREREGARGWMRGVLLGWREVVEHSTPVVRDDSTRWRVRRVGDTCRRANNDKLQRSQALRVSCREAASRVCAARLTSFFPAPSKRW